MQQLRHIFYLAGHSVGLSNLVTPIASPYRDDGQLSQDDGTTDSSCHLFGALHSQANMAIVVTNGNKGLKITIQLMSYTFL